MLAYTLRRLLYGVPILFGVSVIVFALIQWAPGDAASLLIPPEAPKEVVEQVRAKVGPDPTPDPAGDHAVVDSDGCGEPAGPRERPRDPEPRVRRQPAREGPVPAARAAAHHEERGAVGARPHGTPVRLPPGRLHP